MGSEMCIRDSAHHAFTPIPLISVLTASLCKYPTVLTNHSAYLYDYDYLLKTLGHIAIPIRVILSRVNAIIAVSKVAADFIRAFTSSVPIEVIPNAVDINRFNPKGSRMFRDATSDFTLLYVGRLVHRKGVHYLIDSMKFIVKEVPKAKLVIAGDGSLKNILRRRVIDLDLSENVLFMGKVSDDLLPDLYRSADVFVMPSLYGESFGISVLEAMASGLPVIASSVGGIKEVITNNVNGILLESVSPKHIADKVLQLHNDDNLRRRLACEARKSVEENYSWGVIVRRILNVYLKVLDLHKSELLLRASV